jgi:hypothetical protein
LRAAFSDAARPGQRWAAHVGVLVDRVQSTPLSVRPYRLKIEWDLDRAVATGPSPTEQSGSMPLAALVPGMPVAHVSVLAPSSAKHAKGGLPA